MILREFVNMIGFNINEQQFRKVEFQVDGLLNRMESFGKKATFALTLPFVGLATVIGKQLSTFEQLDVAFETMVGNAEEANKLVKDMLNFAAKTPFQINDIGQVVKQLLATGSSAKIVLDELKTLGDVAAGLSVPISRLALNFGQVRAQGKLTGREMRDFAVAGVPLLDELAKNLGVTKKAISGLISSGDISFNDVKKAFQTMTSEGGRFANLMTKQAKTLGGLWSNFLDLIALSIKKMEKQLLPVFKKFVGFLLKMLSAFDRINADLKIIIFGFSAFLAVIGPLTLAFVLLVKIGKTVQAVFYGISIAAKVANVSVLAFMGKFALMGGIFLGVIALLAILIEDLMVFGRGGDSFIGKFLEPWLTLAPKVKAALMPFIIILEDMSNNVKEILRGILNFVAGVFTDDIKQATMGLEQIVLEFIDFLGNSGALVGPILFDVIKGLIKAVFVWIPDLLSEIGGNLAKTIGSWLLKIFKDGIREALNGLNVLDEIGVDLITKLQSGGSGGNNKTKSSDNGVDIIDKIKNGLSQISSFTINDLIDATKIGNQNRQQQPSVVTVNVPLTVPEGTSEDQALFLKTSVTKTAEEVFQKELNNLFFAIPAGEQ